MNTPLDYEVIKYIDRDGRRRKKKNQKGLECIKVKKFKSKALAHFLEPQVHALRIEKDKAKGKKIHRGILKSQLFDKNLKMYCVNESLDKEPYEIGRSKTFTSGWLENHSIWLHMEYKYLLELLKIGLYEDFYRNVKNCLIPFLKPRVYGRSIFENSSFIASSIHPNKKIHGRGFYARLSGSTAEFIHIWIIMMMGKNPYYLDEKNRLNFKLEPILKKDLFLKKDTRKNYYLPDGRKVNEVLKRGSLKFIMFGEIPVTYINPKLKDTFGRDSVKPAKYELTLLNGEKNVFTDNIPQPYSIHIRERRVKELKVYLA